MPNTLRYELVGIRADGTEVVLSTERMTFTNAELLRRRLVARGDAEEFVTMTIRTVAKPEDSPA